MDDGHHVGFAGGSWIDRAARRGMAQDERAGSRANHKHC
jgi:hypothetical protein